MICMRGDENERGEGQGACKVMRGVYKAMSVLREVLAAGGSANGCKADGRTVEPEQARATPRESFHAAPCRRGSPSTAGCDGGRVRKEEACFVMESAQENTRNICWHTLPSVKLPQCLSRPRGDEQPTSLRITLRLTSARWLVATEIVGDDRMAMTSKCFW